MPLGERIIGHVKSVLVNSTFAVNTAGTPWDLGTYPVDRFSGLTGMISGVGSATFRMQFGPSSGTYFVSSSTVANSGGVVIDVVNYGMFVNLALTAVVSENIGVLLFGEPIR